MTKPQLKNYSCILKKSINSKTKEYETGNNYLSGKYWICE